MSNVASFFEKAFSPSYYNQQYKNMLLKSYNYYHPLFRQGSATPLWHAMIGISVAMYTTSYMAYKYGVVQQKHETEKKALAEYYEKHGGAPHH